MSQMNTTPTSANPQSDGQASYAKGCRRPWRKRRLLGLGLFGAMALSAALLGRVSGAFAQDGDEGHGAHFGGGIMQRMINNRVDDALEAIKATPQQRTAIYAVRDRIVAAARQEHAGGREKHQQDLEAALALFTADRFDMAKANALKEQHRAEAQAQWQSMSDTVLKGIAEVHDILNPAQRQALAQYIREHRGHGGWHGRGRGPGGPGVQK